MITEPHLELLGLVYVIYNNVATQTVLTSCLDRKRRERWIESVEGIDFTHSSRKAWINFNRLTGRCARPRQYPVTVNAIAHQLLDNGRYAGASKAHSLNVKWQCSALWKPRGLVGTWHHLFHPRNWPMPSNCSSAGKLKGRITSHQSSLSTLVAIACSGCVSSTPAFSIVSPSRRSGEKRLS